MAETRRRGGPGRQRASYLGEDQRFQERGLKSSGRSSTNQSTNLDGLAIYTKGKLVREAGAEIYYFLISSKKAI